MTDREALEYAAGISLTAIIVHTVIHFPFVESVSRFISVGGLQANLPIFLATTATLYLFHKAVHKYSGIKLFLSGVGLWFLPGIAHDGTHFFYVPTDEVLEFGLHGIPESGISFSLIYTIGMIGLWWSHKD